MVAILALASPFASAEEKEEPEDATVYSAPRLPIARKDEPNAPVGLFVPPPSYRSDRLQGEFVGRPMFVMLDGKKFSFFGARAVSLDENSPLRKLGLETGDVLTRLDGVTLDVDKFEERGAWQMPELERHYGPTEVKWIKQGMHEVRIGQVDLGEADPGETTSLWNEFAIRLLPGFKNVQEQGIDSLPGKLVHTNGREIQYDIGRYYPPGAPRTGGAFENQALKLAAGNRDVVVKQQTIGGLTFYVAQTAERLTISTASIPNGKGINFGCSAKTPAEVADALLMVLSLQAPPAEPPTSSP